MKAIGLTCGIGSMLVGARAAGFKVVGNIEWRRYYHQRDAEGRNTFEMNFKAPMHPHIDKVPEDKLEPFYGADLAMGHPECGGFSQLNVVNKGFQEKLKNAGDIPLFIKMVAKLKPRFFVMDDLPKAFGAFPLEEYAKLLPEYDLFPEWISNYHYGNVQLNRRRMFMIGALKTENFVFRPGEAAHEFTVATAIGDLKGRAGEVANHDPHTKSELCAKGQHWPKRGDRATWSEVSKHFRSARCGEHLHYIAEDGSLKPRVGMNRNKWDSYSHVLDGGSPAIHYHTGLPYSIRERARIQGFPDDFIFYGVKLNDKGEWNHDKNPAMVKQTGKAMPIQFCTFAAKQIAAHIKGKKFKCSGERLIKPVPEIDQAKRDFCSKVGYNDQGGACSACWMQGSCGVR